jgi:desulfoferrodoxin-like iron-binding protein
VKHKLGRDAVANQVGKRYQCTKCNSEMIVTKAGDGELGCCGQPMQQKN